MGRTVELVLYAFADGFHARTFDGEWRSFSMNRDLKHVDKSVQDYIPKAIRCQTAEVALDILEGLQKLPEKDLEESSLKFARYTGFEGKKNKIKTDEELSNLIQLVRNRIQSDNSAQRSYLGQAGFLATQLYGTAARATRAAGDATGCVVM